MKKIALITSGFLPVPAINGGGVEQLCETIINQNENRSKLKIDLYTIHHPKICNYEYENTNINSIKRNKFLSLIYKPINYVLKKFRIKLYFDDYINQLSNYNLEDKEYDYIIIENNMFLFKKVYLKHKGNAKFIFHLHNDIGDFYKPKYLSKFIANNADIIITVSDYIKRRFIELTSCESKKVKCIYNCVADITNDNYIKTNKDTDDNNITFLYCGRFSEEKGLKELIVAFNRLKYHNIKLIIVGTPIYKTILGIKVLNSYSRQIMNYSKNNSKINFVGYVNNLDIYNYYNLADVVVIPTICEEAFGLVAVEAMKCSKAIITTNSGGLIEIVDESCAIIIDKNDIINNLENAMIKVVNNKENIELMGMNSFKLVENKYTQEEYYDRILKVLNIK